MTTQNVRGFDAGEWPLYRELRLKALADSPDSFGGTWTEEKDRPEEEWSTRLKEWTTSPDCHAMLALAGGKPAGLLFARLEGEDQRNVHLYSMWIDPLFRRAGLGGLLVSSVVAWSRQRAAQVLHLRVAEKNSAAIGLYERIGFRRTSERAPLRESSSQFAIAMEMKL